ncbi:MAG: alpha/beta fold hydrolase [Candidatus Omnitrophica bacterium]|nr:alpha/beta fold hydrolase [Candidatus Omnitrophota bacterium]
MAKRSAHQVITCDGIRVAFDLYEQPRRDVALIICHGFFKSKETVIFQQLASRLAGDQDVICMDFRGHGVSGGEFTFSAREDADLAAVLAWARVRYPRLRVMGFSLGGAIAINTLSKQPDGVEALIAVSAPAAFGDIEFKFWTPEVIRTGIQGLGRGAGCRPGNPFIKKDRPIDCVVHLEGMPLLFIHGTKDAIVGVQHSHRLFAAAKQPKHLEIVNGGSHAEALFRDDPEGFIQMITTWQQAMRNGSK